MPAMFYRGDGRIDRLLGQRLGTKTGTEDWIALGHGQVRQRDRRDDAAGGRDAAGRGAPVAADPVAWLGAEHVAR